MDFKDSLQNIFKHCSVKELQDSEYILNGFGKDLSSVQDIIQYLQLQQILDIDHEFIFKLVRGKKYNNLENELDGLSNEFSNEKLSTHVYSYFLYSVLNFLNVSCDKVAWIDPRLDTLIDASELGNAKTLGEGTYVESIKDFDIRGKKLRKFLGEGSFVTVPDGVTYVDVKTFVNNNVVKSISIPNTIEELRSGTFESCQNLEVVLLPDQLETIPDRCFVNCHALNSVLAIGAKSIGDNAFESTKIKNIKFIGNGKLSSIGEHCFKDCDALTEVDLRNVHELKPGAFENCVKLTRLAISINGSTLKNIKKFYQIFSSKLSLFSSKYKNLSVVIINCPDGEIPEGFFEGCAFVERIKVIGSISKIGKAAFSGCELLSVISMNYVGVEIPDECFADCKKLVNIPKFLDVVSIGEKAFYNCESLTGISFAKPVDKLGEYSFYGCNSLAHLNIKYLGDKLPKYSFSKCFSLENFNFLNDIKVLDSYCLAQTVFKRNFILPRSVKHINSNAFSGSIFNEVLDIPSDVKIDEKAFVHISVTKLNFNTLKLINIKGKEILPYELFADSIKDFNESCGSIVAVRIDSNDICENAFKQWEFLKLLVFSDKLTHLPNSCFEGCISLKEIQTGCDNIVLDEKVFANCVKLEKISCEKREYKQRTFDISVFSEIGSKSFDNCTGIEAMEINSNGSIDLNAFNNCTNIKSLTLSIGENIVKNNLKIYSLFANSQEEFGELYNKLSKVRIYCELGEIPELFFENCKFVREIIIEGEVKKLGAKVFGNCEELTHLEMDYIGERLEPETFYQCKSLVEAPQFPNVNFIGEKVFSGCESLQFLAFDSPVNLLGKRAFANCESLEIVSFEYLGEILPSYCFSNCCKLMEFSFLNSVKIISNNTFEGTKFPEGFVLPSNIQTIKAHAFEKAIFNGTLNIPNDVNIEKLAFSNASTNCINIGDINLIGQGKSSPFTLFADNLAEFNQNCSNIIGLKLTGSEIYPSEFKGWSHIQKIIITDSVSEICESAFEDCVELEGVLVDSNDLKIGKAAFKNCTSLKRLNYISNKNEINSNVFSVRGFSSIGSQGFSQCTSLIDVEIDIDGNIEPETFEGCTGIKRLCINLNSELIKQNSKFYSLFEKDINVFNEKYPELKDVMINCTSGELPDSYFENCLNIVNVVVVSTVKKIGVKVFKNCTNLKRVRMNYIGTVLRAETFASCPNIEHIPSLINIEEIEDKAFDGCLSLFEINLKSTVSKMGEAVFKNCSNVRAINFEYAGKSLPKSTFANCSELEVLPLLNDVEIIEEFAFKGCKKISKISINEIKNTTVSNIFADANNIESITYNSENIPALYFANLPKLTKIKFKQKIKVIGNYAFADDEMLSSIGKLNEVERVGAFAFRNCLITSVTINSKAEYIGVGIFAGCNELTSIKLPAQFKLFGSLFDMTGKLCSKELVQETESSQKTFFIPEKLEHIEINGGELFPGVFSNVQIDIAINSSVKEIPDYAFYNTGNIKINMNNVVHVGNHAFCKSKLTKINLPMVETVGNDAFNASAIEDISFGKNIKSLGNSVFDDTDIQHISIEDNEFYETYKEMFVDRNSRRLIFAGKGITGEVTLPDDVISIETGAFKNCQNLVTVNTNNAEIIRSKAFEGCINLIKMTLTEKMAIVEKDVLLGCVNIKEVTSPFAGRDSEDIKSVDYIFGETELNYPLSIILIGGKISSHTFKGLKQFQTIDLSKTKIARIPDNTFVDLMIDQLILPSNLRDIAEHAFVNTKIGIVKANEESDVSLSNDCIYVKDRLVYCYDPDATEISIKSGTTYISEFAFINCESVKEITLCDGEINFNDAFSKMKGLTNISIGLIENQKLEDIFNGSKDVITSIYYSGSTIPSGFFSGITNLISIRLNNANVISTHSFKGCSKLKDISGTNNVHSIEENAFEGCDMIENLSLSSNINSIDPKAFNNCTIKNINIVKNNWFKVDQNLVVDIKKNSIVYVAQNIKSEIIVPPDILHIESKAFSNNPNLVSIDTNKVKTIGDLAFENCYNITKVNISDCVETIGDSILNGCSKIADLSISFIGSKDFKYQHLSYLFSLNKVPDSLHSVTLYTQTIIDKTFANCRNLSSITLSRKTLQIGSLAFENCISLKEIDIPLSVKEINEFAFMGCDKNLNIGISYKSDQTKWDKKWNKVSKKLFEKAKVVIK